QDGVALFKGVNDLLTADANEPGKTRDGREDIYQIPLATNGGARSSVVDFIHRVQAKFPGKLKVQTNAFVTKIDFDDQNRAIGVEVVLAPHVYRADPLAQPTDVKPVQVKLGPGVNGVPGEVIVSTGAFNTPQLLMLSGIGNFNEM